MIYLQFRQDKIICLKQILDEVKDHELTQEIKLAEGLPDIENILGAWGQVLIRSKEWENTHINISGGVMTWVLYTAEGESEPQMVESWIPFQLKWDISPSKRDGGVCVEPNLRIVDARSVSARKIMLRVGVSLLMKAFVPCENDLYIPEQLPKDIQINRIEHNLLMPTECGEKSFSMDEELTLPGEDMGIQLLRYQLVPSINETKVMAEKLVFRGSALLHGLYRGQNGIHNFQMDIPFAQYAQLEQEYDPEATAWIYPAVTGLELELGEQNRLRLKAGMTAQYIICDQKQAFTIEDAYSTDNELDLKMSSVLLPSLIQEQEISVMAKCQDDDEGRVIDRVFLPDQPRIQKNPDGIDVQLSGRFQTLYYDNEDVLRGATSKWEEMVCVADHENAMLMLNQQNDMQKSESGERTMRLKVAGLDVKEYPTVEMITVGQPKQKNVNRPSLILRKTGHSSLWEIAKQTGSTVADIRAANKIDGQPEPGQILLIPVS